MVVKTLLVEIQDCAAVMQLYLFSMLCGKGLVHLQELHLTGSDWEEDVKQLGNDKKQNQEPA